VAQQITGETSVKLHCTVRTSACAATSGSGVIQIREPIVVREFKVPATTNANEPLTITWSYLPGREPQSQVLTGDLFPQPVTLDTSQRSYTFTPQNGGLRTVELHASYARAIPVAPPSKKRRRSASGAPPVITTQARKLELHRPQDCCTAYFVDTIGPRTVPIYVQWYDPCLGYQTETLTLSIVP